MKGKREIGEGSKEESITKKVKREKWWRAGCGVVIGGSGVLGNRGVSLTSEDENGEWVLTGEKINNTSRQYPMYNLMNGSKVNLMGCYVKSVGKYEISDLFGISIEERGLYRLRFKVSKRVGVRCMIETKDVKEKKIDAKNVIARQKEFIRYLLSKKKIEPLKGYIMGEREVTGSVANTMLVKRKLELYDSQEQCLFDMLGICERIDKKEFLISAKSDFIGVEGTNYAVDMTSGNRVSVTDWSMDNLHLKGCVLVMPPGSGKTFTSLALVMEIKARMALRGKKRKSSLVIVPDHLISQWVAEAKKLFGDGVKILTFSTKRDITSAKEEDFVERMKEVDFVICSMKFMYHKDIVHLKQDVSMACLGSCEPTTMKNMTDMSLVDGQLATMVTNDNLRLGLRQKLLTFNKFDAMVVDEVEEVFTSATSKEYRDKRYLFDALVSVNSKYTWLVTAIPNVKEHIDKYVKLLTTYQGQMKISDGWGPEMKSKFIDTCFLNYQPKMNLPEIERVSALHNSGQV